MNNSNIKDFIRGWFVGNFNPSLLKTNDVEVGYKIYKKGDKEDEHYHKIATEITLITKGKVKLNDDVFGVGSIITINPNDVIKFEALEDSENVVVKIPGASNDKYLVQK